MSDKKQKNIRIAEEYHDKLEELAVEWFNSSKKQGQVVERLLDQNEDDSVRSMVSEIHEEVVAEEKERNDTHTRSQKTDAERLEEKAKEQEQLDFDDIDLEIIKGATIDKGEVVYKSMKSVQKFQQGFEKSDVRDFIQDEAGYSYNGANQIANDVVKLCEPITDPDEVIKDSESSYKTAEEYFSDDLEMQRGYALTEEQKKDVEGNNMFQLSNVTDRRKEQMAKKCIKYIQTN